MDCNPYGGERQNAEETVAAAGADESCSAQDHFETGGWQSDAEETARDKKRINDLCDSEQEFTSKKWLSWIRNRLSLLWSYVNAVVSGDYANYSVRVFVKATAGLLYIVSSFDLIPDLFPWVDWADDILYWS